MRSAVNLFDHSVRRKSPKYGLRDWPTCRDDVSGFQRSLRRLCALTQQRPSGPGTAQIETQTDVAFGRRRRPCFAAYASNHVTDLRLSFNCGRTYSCDLFCLGRTNTLRGWSIRRFRDVSRGFTDGPSVFCGKRQR